MLTCYDATFANLLDKTCVDCLLVGDSLGMVLQGQPSTVPVTLQQMVDHTECVARGNRSAWIIGDLPFGSYQESQEQALRSVTALAIISRPQLSSIHWWTLLGLRATFPGERYSSGNPTPRRQSELPRRIGVASGAPAG
jgi:hypothetical protein